MSLGFGLGDPRRIPTWGFGGWVPDRGRAARHRDRSLDEAREPRRQLHWLREAEHVKLWRHLGYVSMLEYLEVVFGYSPKVAGERLRVARKLETLPELSEALDRHELPFSAVRELSRVATPKTERVWRNEARGKCLREIEELVAEHEEGDLPTDQKKPNLRRRRIYFDVLPEAEAEFLEARKALAEEHGEQLDDSALFSAFAKAVLAPASGGQSSGQAKC